MTQTTVYIGNAVSCPSCGTVFWLAAGYEKERRADHVSFWCPNGHSQHFPQETEEERLRKALKHQRDYTARVQAERDQIEASRRAWKGQVTRLRGKVIAGACPFCGQHLRDLERHIGRQHPTEQPEVSEL